MTAKIKIKIKQRSTTPKHRDLARAKTNNDKAQISSKSCMKSKKIQTDHDDVRPPPTRKVLISWPRHRLCREVQHMMPYIRCPINPAINVEPWSGIITFGSMWRIPSKTFFRIKQKFLGQNVDKKLGYLNQAHNRGLMRPLGLMTL